MRLIFCLFIASFSFAQSDLFDSFGSFDEPKFDNHRPATTDLFDSHGSFDETPGLFDDHSGA